MDIYNVPNERRYWVVRAESGTYFDHFTKYGLIAIGHVNCLDLKETNVGSFYNPDKKQLECSFKDYCKNNNNSDQTVSAQFAQINSFIYEMSVGDWVVTVGHIDIKVGRIISSAFIKKDLISIHSNRDLIIDMDFNLRRNVKWGPSLSKSSLPYGLNKSLRANQTVFCIDKNWDAVYHSLYPVFKRGDKLYLSAKIGAKDNIKNFHITSIFNLLNEIEVIGKEFALNNSLNNFNDIYKQYVHNDLITITTKANFNSPGDIWNEIIAVVGSDNLRWMIYTTFAYSLLFGNNLSGFDGLIDLETRQKLWNVVIDRIKVNNGEKSIDSVKLKLPSENTKMLEDSSMDIS